MVNLSNFFPRLLPYVVGCPEPLAQQALLDSAIEFCRRSQVVTTNLDLITVREGVANYELDSPSNQVSIDQVLKVWYDGTLMSAAPYETATALFNPAGAPRYFFGQEIDETFTLTLLPAPETTVRNGLLVRASLRPTRNATQVYDILYDRHIEGVVAGAMGILMSIPEQPFTDMKMAGVQEIKARALANNARFDAMHGRVQSSLSVRMRAF